VVVVSVLIMAAALVSLSRSNVAEAGEPVPTH
jgi:hypothetical protein